MPDTITTLPLDEIVTAIRNSGPLQVIIAASNASGPEWPNAVIDEGFAPELANVRRITALRMALTVRQRELRGNVMLCAAITKIGVSELARVIAGTSGPGWLRACDEARAVHKAFGDAEHVTAWEELSKFDPATDILPLIANGEVPRPIPPSVFDYDPFADLDDKS